MAKGSYPGGGTVIGPRDLNWFGNSGVANGKRDDADAIARRKTASLTAQVEQRIAKLRVDVAGLRKQLESVERLRSGILSDLDGSARDLANLLHHYGLPPAPGLPAPIPAPGTGKTTRHQRRKRAREKQRHGQ